ncbi:MAG TPA: DUF58 domain-containing protein [Chitinophagales bacterium]|nr:DUF58 domain-containing protein [Chitinophagales bacterium]
MKKIRDIYLRFIKQTFLTNRFFLIWFIAVVFFIISFSIEPLFAIGKLILLILFITTLIDFLLVKLFDKKISCTRKIPDVLPLGDETDIYLNIKNEQNILVRLEVIDELPAEFQKRDFSYKFSLSGDEEKELKYSIRPLTRGVYHFGNCNVFVSSLIGLVQHKIIFPLETEVGVYPSSIQVKKHELLLFNKLHLNFGLKKMRKIGHSYEFEQIKNYVAGDDIRTINWKATGRRHQLMINQYGDEKSQQIYSILDKSRAMNMPFDGLSLLDYAVNTTLVISNTAIRKDDKAGVLTFNEKIGSFVKANKKPGQLKLISETLFREEESNYEANFELLYNAVSRLIKQRSLIILYTNFESYYTLERYLPILRKINHAHLLLVVVFRNIEIDRFSYEHAANTLEIYHKTIGKKFMSEKEKMVKELANYGIQSILTSPHELSTQTINKYLEFKARGWI